MSIRRNISWSFISNVVYSGSQWMMLMVIAKLSEPAVLGRYALALAVVAPVFAFTSLQLRVVYATDVSNDHNYLEYRRSRLYMSFLAVVIVVSISYLMGYTESMLMIVLIAIMRFIESLSDIRHGLMQKYERMDLLSKSITIRSISSLVLFSAIFYLCRNINYAVSAVIINHVIIYFTIERIFFSGLIAKHLDELSVYKKNAIKKILLVAFPLGMVMMLNTLNQNIPRYFIEAAGGEEMLGYYAAISYMLVAGGTVINAIGQASIPRLAHLYKNNIDDFIRMLFKVFVLSILIGLAGIVMAVFLGEWILEVMYSVEYAAYNDVFVLIMIASSVLYMSVMLGCGITAARSFVSQSYLTMLVTIALIIASYFLIPTYTLVGAAYALIIAFGVKLLMQVLQIVYIVKLR